MMFFTIIGIAVYILFFYELGYALTAYFDARKWMDDLFNPLEEELDALTTLIAKQTAKESND